MAIAGLLAVAACGGGDDDGADAAASTAAAPTSGSDPTTGSMSTNEWTGETEQGTPLSAELWVDATADDELAAFDEYRTMIDAPEVAYIRVVADNTAGDADDTGRFFTFTGAEGDIFADGVITSTFLCSTLGTDWVPPLDASQDVIDAYAALYNGPCAVSTLMVPVPAGESVTYYLVVDAEPAFERIFAGLGNELTN